MTKITSICIIILTLCACIITYSLKNCLDSISAAAQAEADAARAPQYIQLDREKNVIKFGSSMNEEKTKLIDTKSGKVITPRT
ncbi:hypothetical protein Rhal01_02592 [Rubritalea halochordaticola]|uniref:PepSY domain-containing protein n=1 Tax=Rubritalea halochordaticola TaxID=714537 RepID=A0ABP9V136_9BACT